jgi:hypothetical protein
MGFWVNTDWAAIRRALDLRLNYRRLRVLFSDGGPGIEEYLLSSTMGLQRLPSKGWAALIRKPHIGLRSAALMIRGRLMRTAKRCPHDPWPSHEDCEALPS